MGYSPNSRRFQPGQSISSRLNGAVFKGAAVTYRHSRHSPPECVEVSVQAVVSANPVSERDFANVDVLAAADRVFDCHVFILLVKKPERITRSWTIWRGGAEGEGRQHTMQTCVDTVWALLNCRMSFTKRQKVV